jgi:hypothetical protein
MGKFNIHVLRFFLLLNALPIEKKMEIMSDPSCCDAIVEMFHNGIVEVNDSIVYHIYMYHSDVLTLAMVSEEISNAMSDVFCGEGWSEYGRPTLKQIAGGRRRELMGGRPVISLS